VSTAPGRESGASGAAAASRNADDHGNRVTDEDTLARIRELPIPPA